MAATEGLTKIKNNLSNTDVNKSCKRERANTNWKVYKLTSVTTFAASLRKTAMGRKDNGLPEPQLKNHSFRCSTFGENTWKAYIDNSCLFRALTLHLHWNEELEEEISKLVKLLFGENSGTEPANFRGVCIEYIAAVEDIVQAQIFFRFWHCSWLYD